MVDQLNDSDLYMDPNVDDGLKSGNQDMVVSPVKAEQRKFNENDILGELDRDKDKNLVIPFDEAERGLLDKSGRKINKAGYLVDYEGNVVNQRGDIIFDKAELDENGELPLRIGLERFNFNPFDVIGNFDNTTRLPGPDEIAAENEGEEDFRDLNGRRINKHGYLIDEDGNIINRRGRKVLDKCYLDEDGKFPEMYNMRAKPFAMTSVLGELRRDPLTGDAYQD